MKSRMVALALVTAAVLVPAVAQAQRGFGRYGNTSPMTPFGPLDQGLWRQSGYDPEAYDQLVLQRNMMLQQQALLKQQQAWQNQQKQNGKGKDNTGAMTSTTNQPIGSFSHPGAAKKKHKTRQEILKSSDTDKAKSQDQTKVTKKAAKSSTTTSTTTTESPTSATVKPAATEAASTAKPSDK